ncbi:MAG: PHB depolymerase family esterase [Myxococcota bacterium]|nr:PHB depolymerase family esterase [Myxococcota bacterium]MEC8379817.1 PHB depolymerase family esterase [Myxococcota bacterium]
MHVRFERPIFISLLFVFFSFGCARTGAKEGMYGDCNNEAVDGYQTLTDGDITREYILHLPANYDANAEYPLVISFHGNSGCAGAFGSASYGGDGNSDLSSQADSNGFIVAYPQGIARSKGNTEWDPGDNGATNINDNDVYFVQQLIADISSKHSINGTQIYATGYSNGGMMSYGLACTLGSQIAAVGIMSGIMLEGTCIETDYTPVIHFHGTNDYALPYDGSGDFQSVEDVISFWVSHNQITDPPVTTTSNNGQVTLDSYSGGAEESSVLLYTIEGGGHVWFDQEIDGQRSNDILWNFLSGYDLNGRL